MRVEYSCVVHGFELSICINTEHFILFPRRDRLEMMLSFEPLFIAVTAENHKLMQSILSSQVRVTRVVQTLLALNTHFLNPSITRAGT